MKALKITAAAFGMATVMMASAAHAVEVREVVEIKAAPATVWAKIGDWCAIKAWHPAIANCEASKKGGSNFRTLTLKDGGKIVEKMTKTSKTSYSYDIIDGPLPVKNYSATLAAKADSLGSTDLVWTANFQPKGKTDAEAAAVIKGIFVDGLKSVKEMKFDSMADKAAGAAATVTAAAGAAAASVAAKAKDAVAAVKDAATPAATKDAAKDVSKDAAAKTKEDAAKAKEEARAKAKAERAQRIEAAKVAAMERYAKTKAMIAEKAKAASDAAKAAYEKAKAALSAAMAPKPAEAPKKP
jgi:Polyketide cyclase / dehydrase and lipid transport